MQVKTYDGKTKQSIPLQGTTSQAFVFEQGQCFYKNSVIQNEVPYNNIVGKSLQIVNETCKIQDNLTQKTTIIRLNNKEIRIVDNYYFGSQQPIDLNELPILTSQSNLEPKRLHLFKNQVRDENGEKSQNLHKVTKNLAKNFIRAFQKYLSQNGTKYKLLKKTKMKDFLCTYSYNNKIIQKIIEDDDLVVPFRQFLTKSAKQWIQKSRIKNKEAHIDVVNMFIKVIDNKIDYPQQQSINMDSYPSSSLISDVIISRQAEEESQNIPKIKINSEKFKKKQNTVQKSYQRIIYNPRKQNTI